ncbi:MAG TPA: alpha/beta fold hydrolase [Usitatibacteraceae bacterium]|nr:alpha/beta fold hydrolase [Usitatibacteraceae bacterium]
MHADAQTNHVPGFVASDRFFELPLDYANPDRTIQVYAREVVAPDKAGKRLPYLVFFQGGPGFGSPRPPLGWISRALQEFRVLLLDQRGTARSTPVTAQTLAGLADAEQAEYLAHFRADNIVRDAEAIRRQLIGDAPWSILGQSYGGWCALNYLSFAPEGLEEVFITGGVPPLARSADEIYRATYPRVIAKNRQYYQRYPGDIERVRDIVRHLEQHEVIMPSGGRLSADRFRQLGMSFGMSDGFEAIHYLVEEAFVTTVRGARVMNHNFLVHLEQAQAFDTNPIYTLLHEPIYSSGPATRWSAERIRAEFPQFAADADGPVLFTGEMVYPWMLDVYAQLVPLKGAAGLLAAKNDWPPMFDPARLARNRVPIAAAVYFDDMYVHREFSEETARAVPNLKTWITNEYEHNGLRADGARILERLMGMARGSI